LTMSKKKKTSFRTLLKRELDKAVNNIDWALHHLERAHTMILEGKRPDIAEDLTKVAAAGLMWQDVIRKFKESLDR